LVSDDNDKREIIISKATSDLTAFSASRLIKRGLDIADLAIKSSHLSKAKEILLSVFNDDNLKEQPRDDQLFIPYSAGLLLEISPSQEVISRLLDISKDTDWIDYTRLDALEILAKYGQKDFAVKKIVEIFDHPKGVPGYETHNIRRNAIYTLRRIKEVGDEVQFKIIEFALMRDNFLLVVALQLLDDCKKISQKTYSLLNNALSENLKADNKLDVCSTLIELGYAQEMKFFLLTFESYKGDDSGRIIYQSRELLHKIKIIGSEVKFFAKSINNPNLSIPWRIDLVQRAKYQQTLKDGMFSSTKIDDVEEWFSYLKNQDDFYGVLDLSQSLVVLKIETECVVNQMLELIQSNAAEREYALDILRDIELPLDILQEKIAPCMENEDEELETRISAASILCKHIATRHKAVDFILSQTDYIMGIMPDDEKIEQISLLGYDLIIIDKLFKYLDTPNLYVANRVLACKSIVHMTRK